MNSKLPQPELLDLFQKVLLAKLPGARVHFGFAEDNGTHVEAGVFNVPNASMDWAETFADNLASAVTAGTTIMITPILRSVETTARFYPELLSEPSDSLEFEMTVHWSQHHPQPAARQIGERSRACYPIHGRTSDNFEDLTMAA